MFGYIQIKKDSLGLEYRKMYQMLYCSLCKNIGIYSNILRSMLSYDMVFFMILSNPNIFENIDEKHKTCFAKKGNDVIDYWAKASVLMIKHKIENDISDHDFRLLPFFLFANRAVKRLDSTPVDNVFCDYLYEIDCYEKKEMQDADLMSDLFGKFIKEVVMGNPSDNENVEYTSNICFWIGKWIYLIDAYDDQEKDRKKRDYNPFLIYETKTGKEEAKKYSLSLLMNCVDRITHLAEFLPYSKTTPIIENVLLQWIPFQTNRSMKKRGDTL